MKITLEPKSFAEAVSWTTKNFDNKDAAAYVALVITKDGDGHRFTPMTARSESAR